MSATAYVIVPRGRTAEDALRNRFAPLHTTALSAGRNSGDRTMITRITYRIPDGVGLKALGIDGARLAEGLISGTCSLRHRPMTSTALASSSACTSPASRTMPPTSTGPSTKQSSITPTR